MKVKFFKVFFVAIVVITFITKPYVYAANNYTCNITAISDKTSVKPGEDITYNLKVSNINAGNGLKMVEFYIGNYDSSKFDCKIRNYNEDKWSLVNREGYITITSNNSEAWKTDEILAKIVFTPRTGLTNGTYQTKITNIKSTAADDSLMTLNDLTLNIKVESSQSTSGGTSGESPSGGSTGNSYSCNFSFIPDKTSVKPTEDITYNVKVSNVNAGNGLKMVEFYIGNYDSSRFDCKVRNYNEDKWSLVNREGYITISSNNSEAWKSDETIAKIIYTPKTGLENGTYQTKITNIKATTADNSKITLIDTTLNIKVESSQSTSGGTSGGSTSGGSSTGGSTSGGTSTGGETSSGGTSGGSSTGGSTSGGSSTGESSTGGSTSGGSILDGTETEGKISNGDTSNSTISNGGTSENGTTIGDTSGTTIIDEATKESKKVSSIKDITKKASNKSKSLPYSGDAETLLIFLGIVALISLSVWFFVRYKKLNI
ncbi:MAG: LPXTG cell wall anchor domain-containing protein [Clostridia bacterium]|nr:LPXTG cell wall anchor domain-containing protein [Clostridia bacterium]